MHDAHLSETASTLARLFTRLQHAVATDQPTPLLAHYADLIAAQATKLAEEARAADFTTTLELDFTLSAGSAEAIQDGFYGPNVAPDTIPDTWTEEN